MMDWVGVNCKFMYCLLVICGEEVIDEVIDGKNFICFDEVENCLIFICGLLVYFMNDYEVKNFYDLIK